MFEDNFTVLSLIDKINLGNLGPLLSSLLQLTAFEAVEADVATFEVEVGVDDEGCVGVPVKLLGGVGSFSFNFSAAFVVFEAVEAASLSSVLDSLLPPDSRTPVLGLIRICCCLDFSPVRVVTVPEAPEAKGDVVVDAIEAFAEVEEGGGIKDEDPLERVFEALLED